MKKKYLVTLILTLLLVATLYGSALATDNVVPANRSIYIFGDSWAQQMSETGSPIPFDDALVKHEFDSFITLHKHGISGSTLAQWANNEGGILTNLTTAIANDSDSNPIVFFTLGGNDFFAGSSAEEMATNQTTILTALEATRTDLTIVQGGYDLLNPDSGFFCSSAMQQTFGSTDPTTVNTILLDVYQNSVTIVNQFDRAVSVNTFGSLQGTPGNPTLSEWSPVEFVTSDCIHLTSAGYTIYLDTLFAAQLTPSICSDSMVEAAACEAPLAVTLSTAHTTSFPYSVLVVVIFGLLVMTVAIVVRRPT